MNDVLKMWGDVMAPKPESKKRRITQSERERLAQRILDKKEKEKEKSAWRREIEAIYTLKNQFIGSYDAEKLYRIALVDSFCRDLNEDESEENSEEGVRRRAFICSSKNYLNDPDNPKIPDFSDLDQKNLVDQVCSTPYFLLRLLKLRSFLRVDKAIDKAIANDVSENRIHSDDFYKKQRIKRKMILAAIFNVPEFLTEMISPGRIFKKIKAIVARAKENGLSKDSHQGSKENSLNKAHSIISSSTTQEKNGESSNEIRRVTDEKRDSVSTERSNDDELLDFATPDSGVEEPPSPRSASVSKEELSLPPSFHYKKGGRVLFFLQKAEQQQTIAANENAKPLVWHEQTNENAKPVAWHGQIQIRAKL